jgi:hypothetical protein
MNDQQGFSGPQADDTIDDGRGFVFTVLRNTDREPRYAAKRIRPDKEVGYDKGLKWTFSSQSFPTHNAFAAFLKELARNPFSFIVRAARLRPV